MYFILIPIAVAGGYCLYMQRKLVTIDERVKNAISQIGVVQNSRWDAITEIVKLIEKFSKQEHDTLMDAIDSRQWPNSIIAKQLGLKTCEYLMVDYSKTELPNVI